MIQRAQEFCRVAVRSRYGRVGLQLAVVNYAQAVIGMLISFYLANRLGADGFGLFSYGIVVGSIVTTAVSFASDRTLVRDLVQGANQSAVMTASIVLRALVGLFAMLVVLIWLKFDSMPEASGRVLVAHSIAGTLFAMSLMGWYDSRYEMHRHGLIMLVEKCLFGLLVFIIIERKNGMTIDAVLMASAGLALSRMVGLAIQVVDVRRTYSWCSDGCRGLLVWLLKQNLSIEAGMMANLLLTHVNQIVLARHLSPVNLGYYSMAFQLITVVTLLQSQVVRLFGPRIAELTAPGFDPTLARKKLVYYMAIMVVITAFAAGLLAAVAPLVLGGRLLPDFGASIKPLRILCIWSAFYGPALVVSGYLLGLRLNHHFLLYAVGAGLLSIGVGRLLIPSYGETGVALALLICHPIAIIAQLVTVDAKLRQAILQQE